MSKKVTPPAEVRDVPLAELKPAPWNPRLIKEDRFKNLCKSIKADPDFLKLRPVLAMADGTIYAGNQRFRAAAHLGLATIPAIVSDVPEKLAKERAIRDNNGWGEWQMEELAEVMHELKGLGSDIELLGFDDKEIGKMLEAITLEEVTEDGAPEPPKEPKTKPGDLYLLGEHRLLCGDATRVEDVERLMGGVKADMVFTDPPYNTQMQQGRASKEWGVIENDDMSDAEFSDFLQAVISNLYAFSKTEAHKYVCMGWSAYHLLYQAMPEVKNCIVWVKNNFGLGHGYRPQHEFILFDGGNIDASDQSNVWQVKKDAAGEYSHPTQKPVELPIIAIKNSSKRDGVVLDLFGGSGSTMSACEQTGRTCFMMELDPKYCDVIVARWEKLTGEKAELLP